MKRKPIGWKTGRRIVQIGLLLGAIAVFVGVRQAAAGIPLAHAWMHLDPLVMLAQGLASRSIPAGWWWALTTLGVTLALGRVWCGWLCPVGTVLDLTPQGSKRAALQDPPARRRIKYGILGTLLIAASLGNLTLLVLDPLTIFIRTLSTAVWPAIDPLVTGAETALYGITWLRPAVAGFDGWVRPALLPSSSEAVFFRAVLLYAGIFGGIVALNFLAPRFWCRVLCPLGALLGWVSRWAWIRPAIGERCTRCGACARTCPTGAITEGSARYQVAPAECVMCLECREVCPTAAISIAHPAAPAPRTDFDPHRREALTALGVAVAGVGLFSSDALTRRPPAQRIRPPGVDEATLLTRCLRCGLCSRACPTGAIQPALGEGGPAGLWTPVLIPRLGYCDYACHACGQVCPVEAIPPLSLEDKRQQVLGVAIIDRNRCLPWSQGVDCIICEEMCPVPEKAIQFEEVEVLREGEAAPVSIKRPVVLAERCKGCGLCEYRCPVAGEGAIRVHGGRTTG